MSTLDDVFKAKVVPPIYHVVGVIEVVLTFFTITSSKHQ